MQYTIPQFRENLEKAFDYAESGNEVLIIRYGKTYVLGKAVKSHNIYSSPGVDRSRLGHGDPNLLVGLGDSSDEPRIVPVED